MKERNLAAYHEAGHAFARYHLGPKDAIVKVTIKPKDDFLGIVQENPDKTLGTSDLGSEDSIYNLICAAIVARCGCEAEERYTGQRSTGSRDDLKRIDLIINTLALRMENRQEKKLQLDQEICRQSRSLIRDNWLAIDYLARNLVAFETISGAKAIQIMNQLQSNHRDRIAPFLMVDQIRQMITA